jgi:ribonuclease HI
MVDISDYKLLQIIYKNIAFDRLFKQYPRVSKEKIDELFKKFAQFVKSQRFEKLVIYVDGASRGNPGKSGIGIGIMDKNGNLVEEVSQYIGETTNNVAEYRALLLALEKAKGYLPGELIIRTDSELMARQLNSIYRVKGKTILPLFKEAKAKIAEFPSCSIQQISREENKRADVLANNAIDFAMTERKSINQ